MRAPLLLAQNVKALLEARHQSQADLAQWCYKKPSWMNKFLQGTREVQLKDLDRIADFFGVAAYQLFQPGVSSISERRHTRERRSGADRRIGHVARSLVNLDRTILVTPNHQTKDVSALITAAELDLLQRMRHLPGHAKETIRAVMETSNAEAPPRKRPAKKS